MDTKIDTKKTLDDWKDEKEAEGRQAGEDLAHSLNSLSYEKEVIEGFVDALTTQHRSLQQSSMRAIYSLIQKWSSMEESGNFDLRNEATVKFCKKITDLVDKDGIHFPLV